MIRNIILDFEYHTLIRVGSYKKWVYRVQKDFSSSLFILLFVWTSISFFLTIGVPAESGWSQLSQVESNFNTVSWTLQMFFDRPVFAALGQLILCALVLSFIHLLLALAYTIAKSKTFIYMMGVAVFLGAIISFKIFPPTLEWISLANYLTLAHGATNLGSPYFVFMVPCMLLILALFVLHHIDLNLRSFITLISSMGGYILYIFLCISGVISTSYSLKQEEITIWDAWLLTFYGSTNESFQILSFMYYLIVFFGFLYFIQLYFQRELSEIGFYKIIRYQSLNKWAYVCLRKIVLATFAFLLILFLISIVILWLFGFSPMAELRVFPDLSLPMLFYQYFIVGFLQLFVYTLMVFIVSWSSKEGSHSLFLVGALIVLMLPGLNIGYLLPVGQNALGLAAVGIQWGHSTFVLSCTLIIEAIIIYYLLNKKDIQI
ncbi:hypothetical protein NXZ84_13905 [Mechercharimyces sp. CAU 1602]|nr:hypothetical protein [Mechercharimyces sp. CAU 1602]